MSDYEDGYKAYNIFINSSSFAFIDRNIYANDAAKLFLPPVNEINMGMASPLPKDRQDWINGFNDARKNDE